MLYHPVLSIALHKDVCIYFFSPNLMSVFLVPFSSSAVDMIPFPHPLSWGKYYAFVLIDDVTSGFTQEVTFH